MSIGPSSVQRSVARFVEEHELEAPIQARMLDLASEVGELAKEVLKGADYGCCDFEVPQGWRDELGDVFFALICLANSTGVELEASLEDALQKYRNRLEGSSSVGSGH